MGYNKSNNFKIKEKYYISKGGNKMKCAVLYQVKEPPIMNGIRKPMKNGGYSDSGADIAFVLMHLGIDIVTPVNNPNELIDLEWVFPDDKSGIQEAIRKGADTFWLNTVLYDGHAIEEFIEKGYYIVGQRPCDVSKYDDKYYTNQLLLNFGLSVVKEHIVDMDTNIEIEFPIVLKPIRGRGSQGVCVVNNKEEYYEKLQELIDKKIYGEKLMVEPYLCNKEVTISVLCPGKYNIKGQEIIKDDYWCLPVVERFNHINGISPYSGKVAVIENSRVIYNDNKLNLLCEECIKAARLLEVKSLIRIDCRQDGCGKYYIFDVNMKPNMTGAGRKNRENQDSLTMIAARAIGWEYKDLLINMLGTRWSKND